MSFSKAEKVLNQNDNFNPPPGFYQNQTANQLYHGSFFGKKSRFQKQNIDATPGPGTYNNDRRQKVRKRILDQAKKNQTVNQIDTNSQIKISSIPSIPKKSATRVYEELAPGILILHEQENENSNIGPGTYNPNYDVKARKAVAHKINPEQKKRVLKKQQPQVKIPTLAQQIRNEKRMMYKKNLIKSTGINRSMISPSDLEKLLRSDEGPPPGYYYNQKYQSSFKQNENDWPPQYQLMMGKQQRFKQNDEIQVVGPGSYEDQKQAHQNGGYIGKEQRNLHEKNIIPGPGAYKIQTIKNLQNDPKGNYPPIFGSGCNRFYSADSKVTSTPGPGSYKVDLPKKKKAKFLKIKKDFYDSTFAKSTKPEQSIGDQLFGKSGNKSNNSEYLTEYSHNDRKAKNTHNFSSKVERFTYDRNNFNGVAPGQYDNSNTSFNKSNYNRNQKGYVGSKEARFDDPIIRPHLGPGSYETNYDTIRQKKIKNVKL